MMPANYDAIHDITNNINDDDDLTIEFNMRIDHINLYKGTL